MSVLCYESLSEEYRKRLVESPGDVGANGMPLDVIGRTKIVVSLGSFSSEEEFTVIRNLTVDCLLGADFLKDHGAVMDCGSSTLTIGKRVRHKVPMLIRSQNVRTNGVAVTAPVDMEIPGRTIQLIHGELQGDRTSFNEALVEPACGTPPTHVCCPNT